MRLRSLAIVLLLVVGVGAVGLVVFSPAAGSNAAARFLTSVATRTTVRDQVVATGSLASSATYGLGFGREPALINSSSTSASSGAVSTAIVKSVDVKVGDKVIKGQPLASADDTDSAAQLTTAQANLDSANGKLADDLAAPTEATIAAAQASIDQATQQLKQAKTSQADSKRQNALSVTRAKKTLADARAKKAADVADGASDTRIDADQDAIENARQSLAETQSQVTTAAHQSASSVASAQLSLSTAKADYATKTAKTSETQLASDRAAVATAETAVATAERTLELASIVSPVDGTVVSVTAVVGLGAPSGDAVQIAVAPMQVTSQFAEADITRIAAGQPAIITVSAIGASLDGVVGQVTPTASSSGTGSVVTYAVTVTITGSDPRLTSGMSASVAVAIAEATDVVAVPATALQGTGGAYTVRVLDAAGQVSVRTVEVGLVTSSMAEIRSGLDQGEQVVTGTVAARQGTTTTNTNAGGGGAFPGGGVPGGGFPGGGIRP